MSTTKKKTNKEIEDFRNMVLRVELEARFWTAQASMKESYIKNHELGPKYNETYEEVEKLRQEQEEAMAKVIQQVEEKQSAIVKP